MKPDDNRLYRLYRQELRIFGGRLLILLMKLIFLLGMDPLYDVLSKCLRLLLRTFNCKVILEEP